MTAENFCFWINGFAELNTEPPTKEQWKLIKEHLDLVFDKKTSNLDDILLNGKQEETLKLKKKGLSHFC
jgi:hypothetical protein